MSIEKIDQELCTGCGICVNTCPLDVIRLDTFIIDKPQYSPCRLGCPAGINMRGYIALLQEGKIDKALEVLRETNPLPAITGRVCANTCESECVRNEVDEPVNIRSLERYLGDYSLKGTPEPVPRIYAFKVAIIGSGPAGLSAAHYLIRMGYPVTVFEAMSELGGMLRIGIPEYILPKDVVNAQIRYIEDLGVEFRTRTTIGIDLTLEDLKKQGYSSVFFALGAQLSNKLDMEGSDLKGVLGGLDFLRKVNKGRDFKIKARVLIVGGGNVAFNVASTALRLGAKQVQVVCLEPKDEMNAKKEEVQQAIEEGVIINESWGPRKILGDNGKVTGVELVGCVRVFDGRQRFAPLFDENKIRIMDADMVIMAVGQHPDLSDLPREIERTEDGMISADPITMATAKPGFFAGGDVATGTASVIEAIKSGRSAALSIDRYLRGEDFDTGRRQKPKRAKNLPRAGIDPVARNEAPILTLDERRGNFNEVKSGVGDETAWMESFRCKSCGSKAVIKYVDDCMLCDFCELDCPEKAIYVSPIKCEKSTVAWG